MTTLYFIICILLLIFIYLIRKVGSGFRLLKSFSVFFIIFIGISAAFILDYSKPSHILQAMESLKQWIKSPLVNSSKILEDKFDLSIIKIQDKVMIDAPALNQFPELPRGCEVTALAMLLQHAQVDVDKMTLANQIKKDSTPYQIVKGKVYFGNPNDGFVGNMYTFDEPGLGVYHKPVKELAETYLPGKIKDLTGSSFQELKVHLSDNRPVWVIINTTYKKLSQNSFETWHTPSGEIDITFKEHAVLLTGYDQDFIYFNDPLTSEKNKKTSLKDFEEAWEQMGSQAITYVLN